MRPSRLQSFSLVITGGFDHTRVTTNTEVPQNPVTPDPVLEESGGISLVTTVVVIVVVVILLIIFFKCLKKRRVLPKHPHPKNGGQAQSPAVGGQVQNPGVLMNPAQPGVYYQPQYTYTVQQGMMPTQGVIPTQGVGVVYSLGSTPVNVISQPVVPNQSCYCFVLTHGYCSFLPTSQSLLSKQTAS